MGSRYADWFRQAEAALRHARNSLEDGDFEWSCFLPVGFPVGVDLFAYTRAEFERLRETSPDWYQAIAAGEEL